MCARTGIAASSRESDHQVSAVTAAPSLTSPASGVHSNSRYGMRLSHRPAGTGTLFATLALGLVACTGESSAPSGAAPLTQAEAQVVGVEMQGEIAGITSGASLQGFLTPSFAAPPAAVRAFGGALHFVRPPNCPTFSEFPPTDADGDHVPDNLTLTFDPATCSFTGSDGNSIELSGAVTITDPSQVNPGVRVSFAAFQHKATLASGNFFRRAQDGVWKLVSDPTGFAATDSTTTVHESTERGLARLTKAWQVDFVVEAGQVFAHNHGLPSGDFTLNGSTTRTHGAESKSFTITTVTPLHHDATCADDQKVVSGELHVVHTDARGTATVDIVFNGCGVQPTIILVTGPTAS